MPAERYLLGCKISTIVFPLRTVVEEGVGCGGSDKAWGK